jgi:hypothetical protein
MGKDLATKNTKNHEKGTILPTNEQKRGPFIEMNGPKKGEGRLDCSKRPS